MKVLNFFLSIIPAVMFLLMEYAVTIMAMLAYMFLNMSIKGMSFDEILEELMVLAGDPNFSTGIMIIFECFILVGYGFWYYKVTSKSEHVFLPKNANTLSVCSILLLSVGMVVIIFFVTYIEDLINPAWLDTFETIMEDAGLAGDMSIWAVIYACIIAPVTEELIFRGLVQHYACKAFPVWFAIVYQAILFGIFHMNMYQGIYAFAAGLFMGFIAWYGGNIMWSVLLHMVYNTIQSVSIFAFVDYAYDNYFYFIVLLTGGVLVCITALYWYVMGIDRKNEENRLYEQYLEKYKSGELTLVDSQFD